MRRHVSHITCLLFAVSVHGQVMVDKPIVLDGATPQQRQVNGILPSIDPNWPLTAGTEQSGAHRTATVASGNNWQITLPSLQGSPGAGTHIVLLAPNQAGTGPVQLTVNADGPYPVLIAPGSALLADQVSGMPTLSLVFDGVAFQVMNGRAHERRTCPAGMVAVSDQYCIDIAQQDTTDFFAAGTACVAQNKRLCSWGEWYGACQQTATLSLQNMTDNWEWTGDAANEDNGVRIVGPTCSSAGTWSVINAPQCYRCCYTR